MKRVLPLIVALAACQSGPKGTTVYDHCAVFNQQKWKVVTLEEPLADSLISITAKDSGLEEAISFEGENVTEVWFKSSEGDIKFCRYEHTKDACSSKSVTLEFRLVEGIYEPSQVMEKVCMVHSYRT